MNHAVPADAGLYDREQEQAPGRRRRDTPDWGGDELFATAPGRRRFDRPARGEHPAERVERPRIREVAPRLRETMEHPIQRPVARTVPRPPRRSSPLELPEVTERTIPLPAEPSGGRRTVTITGHPDRVAPRRRPAPTIDERLYGAHPERIAMYAFALGVLLIVIAFLSANA